MVLSNSSVRRVTPLDVFAVRDRTGRVRGSAPLRSAWFRRVQVYCRGFRPTRRLRAALGRLHSDRAFSPELFYTNVVGGT